VSTIHARLAFPFAKALQRRKQFAVTEAVVFYGPPDQGPTKSAGRNNQTEIERYRFGVRSLVISDLQNVPANDQ
jgi:hypothetical protein